MVQYVSPLIQASLAWTLHQKAGLPSPIVSLADRVSWNAGALRCADGMIRKVRAATLQLQVEASRSQSWFFKQSFLGCLPSNNLFCSQSKTPGSWYNPSDEPAVSSPGPCSWAGISAAGLLQFGVRQQEAGLSRNHWLQFPWIPQSGKRKISSFEKTLPSWFRFQSSSKRLPHIVCMSAPTRSGRELVAFQLPAIRKQDTTPSHRPLNSMGTEWHHQRVRLIPQPEPP